MITTQTTPESVRQVAQELLDCIDLAGIASWRSGSTVPVTISCDLLRRLRTAVESERAWLADIEKRSRE